MVEDLWKLVDPGVHEDKEIKELYEGQKKLEVDVRNLVNAVYEIHYEEQNGWVRGKHTTGWSAAYLYVRNNVGFWLDSTEATTNVGKKFRGGEIIGDEWEIDIIDESGKRKTEVQNLYRNQKNRK